VFGTQNIAQFPELLEKRIQTGRKQRSIIDNNPVIDESEMKHFETVVRPIPQYDPESPKMISQGPSVCVFNKEDPQEVLASWIFTQYLLTNGVQIPYAETEGYIPVTTRAHSDEEYKDYLSRSGENTDLYYDVKIEASKLVLENIGNTFVTPVFNGSADLRDAAGQLIEEVAVAGRKTNDKIDGEFIDKVYERVATLNHLKQMSEGGLPTGSIILVVALPTIWVMIGAYLAANYIKNKKKTKNH
jgi:multiple sugar transport system substrate-binding protein